jgi:hypothetical protein
MTRQRIESADVGGATAKSEPTAVFKTSRSSRLGVTLPEATRKSSLVRDTEGRSQRKGHFAPDPLDGSTGDGYGPALVSAIVFRT